MRKILLILLLFTSNIIVVSANVKEKVTLIKCVDGDTAIFNINGTKTRVRFLAIDTPESVKPDTDIQKYGKNASEYSCNRLTNAKEITLEYDNKSDNKDKYDRTLAWVWIDGSLLEEELLKIGYAKIKYVYSNYSYLERLNSAQKIAKEKKLGIWINYNPNLYSVTFKDGEKETNIEVEENSTIEPMIPTKDGYEFIGWYKDNKKFDFNTKITSNIILNAKYEKQTNLLEIAIISILLMTIYIIKRLLERK